MLKGGGGDKLTFLHTPQIELHFYSSPVLSSTPPSSVRSNVSCLIDFLSPLTDSLESLTHCHKVEFLTIFYFHGHAFSKLANYTPFLLLWL